MLENVWAGCKGFDIYIHYLDSGLGEELTGQIWVKRSRHGEDREVLGRDASVLAAHVRVEAVPGLGHCAAEDAAVSRTQGVLVLHVRAQSVRAPVNLPALGARPGVCGAHSHHLQLT